MKQTTITIKHIIQKDLANTNTFKYNIYRHTTKTNKTHIHGHNNLIITAFDIFIIMVIIAVYIVAIIYNCC